MSLTNSVVERIAEVIKARLETLVSGVRPTSPVCEVVRPLRFGGYSPKHYQLVLTQTDEEQPEVPVFPGATPRASKRQVFVITAHLMPPREESTPIDTMLNNFYADVQYAIVNNDPLEWQNFNGLAIEAEFLPYSRIDNDDFAGFRLPLSVTYRHQLSDPYTVA